MNGIGIELRRVRLERGFTLRELAAKAGIKYHTISNYERDPVKARSWHAWADNIFALEAALDLPPGYFAEIWRAEHPCLKRHMPVMRIIRRALRNGDADALQRIGDIFCTSTEHATEASTDGTNRPDKKTDR